MRYLLPYFCFLLYIFATIKRTNDRIVKSNLKMFIATLSLLFASQEIHCKLQQTCRNKLNALIALIALVMEKHRTSHSHILSIPDL